MRHCPFQDKGILLRRIGKWAHFPSIRSLSSSHGLLSSKARALLIQGLKLLFSLIRKE